jgi:hypothetical protein
MGNADMGRPLSAPCSVLARNTPVTATEPLRAVSDFGVACPQTRASLHRT